MTQAWDSAALTALCRLAAALYLLFFFGAMPLLALAVEQRRYGQAMLALGLGGLSFVIFQLLSFLLDPSLLAASVILRRAAARLNAGRDSWFPLLTLGLCAGELLLLLRLLKQRRSLISPASVKETLDTLPTGLCRALPGGRVLLVNRAMEELCWQTLGTLLVNAREFQQRIWENRLLPGCESIASEENRILLLPDGKAYAFSARPLPGEDSLTVLMASDITDTYRKTLRLEQNREQLVRLNRRLAAYNREIVSLTIQQEILNARVRLHDELGADLLVMKRLLRSEATEQERESLRQRLRNNVSSFRIEETAAVRDEYDLMLRTAEQLGVTVEIRGELPQQEPWKHIVATGIHECFTNTLRHAHGDRLLLSLQRQDGRLTVRFVGNGDPPSGPFRERGGLASLRALTLQAGGSMEVRAAEEFAVTLSLPEELAHGL